MLDYQGTRHVGHGDDATAPPRSRASSRRPRPDLREPHGHPRQLPRCCFCRAAPRSSSRPVPMNLMQEQGCRLHRLGQLVEEGLQGGASSTATPSCVASSEDENFTYVPDVDGLDVSPRRRLRLHLPERDHLRHALPQAARHQGDIPLVSDVSRMFLSEPVDVTQVRPHLRRRAEERRPGRRGHRHRARRPHRARTCCRSRPPCMRYKTQADAGSPVEHPAVLRHLHVRQGVPVAARPWAALTAMQKRQPGEGRASSTTTWMQSKLFRGTATQGVPLAHERAVRHRATPSLDAKFVAEAKAAGHREPQGTPQRGRHARQHLQRHARRRASEALVQFMDRFEKGVRR